jgi:hypothetical protein
LDQASGKFDVRIVIAAALSLVLCTPLLADTLIILRCDARGEISFSVSIDPIAHTVHSMGFATKIETDQFSDTVIAASSKESTPSQTLVIDRITGQFQVSWIPANSSEKGGNYQGSCSPARRLF